MADEVKTSTTDTKVEPEKKQIKEETIGTVTKVEEPKSDTVPLAKYMESRNETKELKARVAELEKSSKTVDQDDIEALAKEFDADPKLLKALEKRFGTKPASTDDSEIKAKLAEIEADRKADKLDKIFDGLWNKALEVDADLMAIADKDSLKKLALLPENQGLTLTQLAEKTYEKAVKGKKTIESSTAQTREKTGEDVDFSKMSDEDWDTVKGDPALKAKYEDYIIKSIKF